MFGIDLIAAPLGSGKTTVLAHDAIKQAMTGGSCLIVQPTKELNRQTAATLLGIDPSVHLETINGDTRPNKAVHSLFEHMCRPFDGPHIVLTTFSAFVNMPRPMNFDRFHLRIDEIPKAFESTVERIPCNHRKVTDAIEVQQCGSTYGEVLIKDKGILRAIAENQKDDAINALLRPFAQIVVNRNYRNFVDLSQYSNLLKGMEDDPNLRIFSLLRPETFQGFQSVKMFGARAHETLLYKWFEQQGIRFRDDEEILDRLRYREHHNGNSIDFYYGSKTNWSLYAQEQDETIRPKVIKASIALLNDQPFCWLDNKRFEDDNPLSLLPGNEKLPHSAHGLNEFQHHDRIVILTAFNLPSPEANFLENFVGISKQEQKVAHDYHNTHQTLGRISIRDPNNNNRKMVILPDRQNAEWQSLLFPGSRVHSLNVDDRKPKKGGRVKQYENSTERKRANRARLKAEQDALVDRYDLGHERILEAGYHMSCHDCSYKSIRENVTAYQGSIINNKYEGVSFPVTMSNKEFGQFMKGLHKRVIADKNSNQLIMPALCVPVANTDTQRAEDNALWGRHIYLDLDDTELTPLTLSRIFPHLEMICYNSFSHTPEKPRYRAIFLTDDVMTPEVYKFFWYQIVQRIENAGYYGLIDPRPKGERKLHGIDNKPNVVSPFYLPSQPKEGKGFYFHYSKSREPLNVGDWIENPIATRFDSATDVQTITADEAMRQVGSHQEIIDAAMSRYRAAINTTSSKTGARTGSNEAMFNLALSLKGSGVDRIDADMVLTQAANESRSKKDRISDKGRYMRRFW